MKKSQFEIVEGVKKFCLYLFWGKSLVETLIISIFKVNVHTAEIIQEQLNPLFPSASDHTNKSSKNPTHYEMPLEL